MLVIYIYNNNNNNSIIIKKILKKMFSFIVFKLFIIYNNNIYINKQISIKVFQQLKLTTIKKEEKTEIDISNPIVQEP